MANQNIISDEMLTHIVKTRKTVRKIKNIKTGKYQDISVELVISDEIIKREDILESDTLIKQATNGIKYRG